MAFGSGGWYISSVLNSVTVLIIGSGAGKGSGRRRSDVPDEVVASNWKLAFGKKNTDNSSSVTEEPAPAKEAEEIYNPHLTINS